MIILINLVKEDVLKGALRQVLINGVLCVNNSLCEGWLCVLLSNMVVCSAAKKAGMPHCGYTIYIKHKERKVNFMLAYKYLIQNSQAINKGVVPKKPW